MDLSKLFNMLNGMNGDGSTKKPQRAAYVKIHPNDQASKLADLYYTHPRDWKPQKALCADDETPSHYEGWGCSDESTDGDVMTAMIRKMETQSVYRFNDPTPEEQFCNYLRDLWRSERDELRKSAPTCDYVIHCEFTPLYEATKPKCPQPIWRDIRCSPTLTLRAFADKILIPCIGFCRNYHAWIFQEQQRRAAWCFPKESTAIDCMHLNGFGYSPLDDKEVQVRDFWRAVGEKVIFYYDLGDRFSFEMTLTSLVDDGQSRAELLDGEGAAPPEDSNGFSGMGPYNLWDALQKGTFDGYEAAKALNYKGVTKFVNMKEFDIKKARKRLEKALESPASAVSGSKVVMHQFSDDPTGEDLNNPLKPGQEMSKTRQGGRTFVTETINTGAVKDESTASCCANCGASPERLKLCSACRSIRYCSAQCQKIHWKQSHKKVCKAARANKK